MQKLVLKNVSKSYGPTCAFKNGYFALEAGEVHALMGTNGSGKSTLCKIVAGSVKPDSGTVSLNGKPVTITGPQDARTLGIGIFYQELSLAINRSVAENIFISQLPLKYGVIIDQGKLKEKAEHYIKLVRDVAGEGFEADAVVGDLRADQKQLVEILKALATEADVLIFDEPTSALDRSQVKCFFDILRDLKAKGRAMIMISHRMDEIFEVSDRLTIIRDGAIVGTRLKGETTPKAIVELMVGEQVNLTSEQQTDQPKAQIPSGETLLKVSGLSGKGFKDVSFSLKAHEIVGFGGLHGQGQSSVLRALFGANAITEGGVELKGCPYTGQTPRAGIAAGCAYVSGDRVRDGVIQGRSILENTVPVHAFRQSLVLSSRSRLSPRAKTALAKLTTKYESILNSINSLSGGNQQKVVIARWLIDQPDILLLDDPTKGIDLSAKSDLFALIRELAADGLAIILYSSEDAELLNNSDRILVFNGGSISRELAGEGRTRFNLYDAAYEVAS
ncbi:sugar ABC transporter ATP-binding protein [Pseudovibrio sp. Tun.PSC04-5.I4]|uniref:sugar ABC transporter ATP-binding protein n=1 Tax=Pseudovibrio sp. Tun.PSC04-5.I4 TaxID=1798213 RepID=UPI00088AC56E|nr:sugar ABC transporter ATP-binding protein [Pseudovibrio sp. Tun.PSC04-5.I4]SDR01289.1 monosaccharide ABC transporter ATP-binding protein, CUT2 family [Pseudovibrio sp. Tun.PSC04-5.I4]